MTNEIKNFDFNGAAVRVVVMQDGEPWWVASDVCKVLELTNPSQAISELEEDERNTLSINEGNRGNPIKAIISEAGLYSLILRSRKPEAKAFKRWVTHEVLPAIRKHGSYSIQAQLPQDYLTALKALVAAEEEKQALAAKVEADAPKVLFADSVSVSHTDILIGDLAKLLRQNGVEIGQNRLFEWLRANGYLIRSGERRNMPTQEAMERGLFRVKERTIDNPDGSVRITRTTKVTGKGQIYFINKILSKEAA